MSAIITAITQLKNGAIITNQRELNHVGPTTGHDEVAGGLRGHSIDHETYPWRVVGHPGGAWSVVGADGTVVERIGLAEYRPYATSTVVDDIACEEAHALARRLKIDFPSGRVEE